MSQLALYLHLPWCVRKCPYCDFNSHSSNGDAPTSRYVDALLIDLEREAQRARGRVVDTIFLGGGTPSLFPPAEIGRLLDGAARCLTVAADAEGIWSPLLVTVLVMDFFHPLEVSLEAGQVFMPRHL